MYKHSQEIEMLERYILNGYSSCVQGLAITPDGQRVLTGWGDGTIKVSNLSSGACEKTLSSHTNCVRACAVTADGQRVVSASFDNTLKVWNLVSGVCERTFSGHTDSVIACAVTADGQRLVSCSCDNTLKVWNLSSGACEKTLSGHTGYVIACALSADGGRVVSCSDDKTLKVWNLLSGACEKTLISHTDEGYFCAITITPDGQRVVSGAQDGVVKVWRLSTGECEHTLGGGAYACPRAIAITPDGQRVIIGGVNNTIVVHNLATGVHEQTLQGAHTGRIHTLAITPDGQRMVTGAEDMTVKVWDIRAPQNKLVMLVAPELQLIQTDLDKLLLHVARGEQEQAEAMLKIHPTLLLHKGSVTDYSNRTFQNITAFQYALWALDWHMWKMITNYLPQEAAVTQLRELEANGTAYGKHYDFRELLQAYQIYLDNYKSWNWAQQDEHWCTVIGRAQTQVPAHLANQYCRPDQSDHSNFMVWPNFEDPVLPRVFKLDNGNWFPQEKNKYGFLGQDFGIASALINCPRCIYRRARGLMIYLEDGSLIIGFDSRAVARLFKVRTEQYEALKKLLLPEFRATPLAQLVVAPIAAATSAPFPVVQVPPQMAHASVEKLLIHVARGEQDEAEAILKINSTLLLQKGIVTDYSNRTFQNITAFQYALWALDWHMWTMITRYLPSAAARDQLRELETQGTANGKHYDFNELLQAYKTYVDNGNLWTYEKRNKHSDTLINAAQFRVPAHVANECCRRSLPTSDFKETKLPRTVKLDDEYCFFNDSPSGIVVWTETALFRVHGAHLNLIRVAFFNLSALTELCKVRTEQYKELKQSLS